MRKTISTIFLLFFAFDSAAASVSREHPRLLGSAAELKALAKARPQEFQRMAAVAKGGNADNHSLGLSMALAAVVNDDAEMARAAQQLAMKLVNGPIRKGHVTFGSDLALTGLIYDLCYSAWPEEDRAKFHDYFNQTVDANVESETHVFHNAWYSYKNWGIGIGAYACYYENPRAPKIIETLEADYRTRAAPALELAGAGGGWAEGYYIHYWLYEWLFFCEVARRCGGVDYYALAPSFYKNRALASAFETYPGLSEYNSRRPIPMGDGGGRLFGGDRDKQLAARRILVSFFRDDPTHQALHTFNETTPRVATGNNAYKDFLWRDETIPKGDLGTLPLSHFAAGPGFVYARSSWKEDATHFFFKAGDRFTAHQHLDNGHFLIYCGGELAGDGGHYEGFGTGHDVNYHARTIAHSTVLVLDPEEKWPAIRGGKVTGNEGGQHHNWPHHNGASSDPQEWQKNRGLYDIADFNAFKDEREFVYMAGDLTRAYSSNKMERFTRQIVYVRPGTFVVFDQVTAKKPEFRKTWLLQAMKAPTKGAEHLVITNGTGKLFVQTVLPAEAKVNVASGEKLYAHGGESYAPKQEIGKAPEARIEVSPSEAAKTDLFLHVLTATDSGVAKAPIAKVERQEGLIVLRVGEFEVSFNSDSVGGKVRVGNQTRELAAR